MRHPRRWEAARPGAWEERCRPRPDRGPEHSGPLFSPRPLHTCAPASPAVCSGHVASAMRKSPQCPAPPGFPSECTHVRRCFMPSIRNDCDRTRFGPRSNPCRNPSRDVRPSTAPDTRRRLARTMRELRRHSGSRSLEARARRHGSRFRRGDLALVRRRAGPRVARRIVVAAVRRHRRIATGAHRVRPRGLERAHRARSDAAHTRARDGPRFFARAVRPRLR